MSFIQQLTTMVIQRIQQQLKKIPMASHRDTGILRNDNITLIADNRVITAPVDKQVPGTVIVATPTSVDGLNKVYTNDMEHIEISLISKSLLITPSDISHMEIYFNNGNCLNVAAVNNTCTFCIYTPCTSLTAIAVDTLGNRSIHSLIYIEHTRPTVIAPEIILPNKHIVDGSSKVPYATSAIQSIPTTDNISVSWTLRGSDHRELWSSKTLTNYTDGPAVSDLPYLTRSSMYHVEDDTCINIIASTITTYKGKVYYTSDADGSIYTFDNISGDIISIPELRYCYKAMSTSDVVVFCSSMYIVYSTDGLVWNSIQHPTNIVDITVYDDVIYLLDTSGTVLKYNTTTEEYYKPIYTNIHNAKGCSVDELTLYIVTFDTAYAVDTRTGDISVLYSVEHGNFKDVSVVNDRIVINNTRTIYYFDGKWISVEFDNEYITKVVSRDGYLAILMSSGNMYIATDKMIFTSLSVSNYELVDITIVNNVCYITDNCLVHITKPIVPLSEVVTMYVKCVATDVRYNISDTVSHTYQYKLA